MGQALGNVLPLAVAIAIFPVPIIAVVLLKQFRGRAGEEPQTPGWKRTIGDLTTLRAGGAGFALAALNPKNALLAVAAAAEIAAEGLPASEQAGVLLCFVLVASVGVLTPVALAVVLGERSRPVLDGVRSWMERNNAVVTAVLLVVVGAKLAGDAISGFSS